ncbi:MAG: DUF2225 domain-containing protein [Oscillospiraceae bacterium]
MIDIELLKDTSRVRKYKTGTMFCKDGVGNDMYILISGKVAVINSLNRRMLSVIGPNDFFNEFLAFSEERIHVNTVALTDVTVVPLSKFSMPSFLAEEPKLAFELMRAMYERFNALNDEYETLTGHRWVPKIPVETEAPPAVPQTNTGRAGKFAPKKAAQEVVESVPAGSTQAAAQETSGQPLVITHENCPLFPEGHTGKYTLKLARPDNSRMCEIDYNCPVCGATFKGLKVLTSRLGASTTDHDTRKHYKNFDPIYYEVVTCPFCLFSAFASMFNSVEDVDHGFLETLQVYHNINFKFGVDPDLTAVFASYFLALICAPQCFSKPQLIEASLLHRLSWIYHDCGDTNMEETYRKLALERYTRGYVELVLSADKEIHLCMILGELSYETGNLKDAKNYYYKAKTNPLAPAFLQRRAANRLEDLREYEQAQLGEAAQSAGPEPGSKGRLFKHGQKN